MSSAAFEKVLKATGYLGPNGQPAPGLTLAGETVAANLRTVLKDDRVGLNADAVFSAHSAATSIFKDAGDEHPEETDIRAWHEAAWNIGVAPLLWIVTPTDVRLYDCYSSPPSGHGTANTPPVLDRFVIDAADRMRALDATCGRLATETGAFWSSPIGSKINRRHRVDRELLSEISALEQRLVELTPDDGEPRTRALARDLAGC